MGDPFRQLYGETSRLEGQKSDLLSAQQRIQTGMPLRSGQTDSWEASVPNEIAAVAGARSASGGGISIPGVIEGGDPKGDAAAVTAYIGYLDEQISNNVARLYSMDSELAYEYYPDYLGENADEIKKMRALLGGGGGDSYHPPVQAYGFQVGPGGDVIRTNSVTGAVEMTGMKVPQGSQVVTNTRDGHAYAVNIDTGDRQDLGVVAFPDIDPERKFRFDVLSTAASLEQQMAGIELQKRGMAMKVIADDFSNQVALGNMVYTEANLNLNRIDSALTQRREERAQLLKYAVKKSSLRMRDGQEVTLLPFGNQLAQMLSEVTGKSFTEKDFELSTTYINPEGAASDVMNASSFNSPIPGLQQSAQQARASMDAVLGAPYGGQQATQQLTQMAIPGV